MQRGNAFHLPALAIALASALPGQAQCLLDTLSNSPGLSRGGQQHDIAFGGDMLFEGIFWEPTPFEGRGVVRIYQRDGDSWSLRWELTSPDANDAEEFGFAVCPVGPGPRLLVGDPAASVVWELLYNGSAWEVTQEIAPPRDGVRAFGSSIDVDGDRLAVGAPSSDAVFTFERVAGLWMPDQELTPSPDYPCEDFGSALDLAGKDVLVGGREGPTAYLWRRGINGWNAVAHFEAPDEDARTFGQSVLRLPDRVVVGQPDGPQPGRVHVYQFVSPDWMHETTLSPWDIGDDDWALFGWDLAAIDGRLVVQAMHGSNYYGAAYLYENTDDKGWLPFLKLTPRTAGRHHDWANVAAGEDVLAIAGITSDAGFAPIELYSFRPRCLCVADFNEDGLVNPADVTAYLNAWVSKDLAADVNQDGAVNIADFIWFLNEWNTRENCL